MHLSAQLREEAEYAAEDSMAFHQPCIHNQHHECCHLEPQALAIHPADIFGSHDQLAHGLYTCQQPNASAAPGQLDGTGCWADNECGIHNSGLECWQGVGALHSAATDCVSGNDQPGDGHAHMCCVMCLLCHVCGVSCEADGRERLFERPRLTGRDAQICQMCVGRVMHAVMLLSDVRQSCNDVLIGHVDYMSLAYVGMT